MNIEVVLIIAAIVVFIFLMGYINEKKQENNRLLKIIESFGKKCDRKYSASNLENIKGYYNHHDKNNSIDDITWNDLDMWQNYKKINRCLTSSGDEYLYYLLKNPKLNEKELLAFDEKVTYFSNNKENRDKLTRALASIGRLEKFSVYDYLYILDKGEGLKLGFDIILDLLYIVAIVLCIVKPLIGVITALLLIFVGISSYFSRKRKIECYISCFSYIFKLLENAKYVIDCNLDIEEVESLKTSVKAFDSFKRFSGFVMTSHSGNPVEVILDYVRMLTHIDLMKFNSMLNCVKEHMSDADNLITAVGKLDVYISVASYREYIGKWCKPQFVENIGYKTTDIYHPLLEDAVANNLDTKKSILLTGANASGKSTFLKTIALNSLLAQTIYTVCATKYTAPMFRIISSLSLKDSIIKGESYYMAEINSLKRIMDSAAKDGAPVLAFVDEVLRGTNTTERIAASSAILAKLSSLNCLMFAATHDLELTEILKEIYDNYHFEENVKEDDICFPYKIIEGKANSRNAIKLLVIKGYDDSVADKATAMAVKYEKEGIWTL